MYQKKLRPFKPKATKSHAIEKIISAPLVAAAHANSMMQKEQTAFMMETGFKEVNGKYIPEMIEMVLTQHVMDQNSSTENAPGMKTIETSFNLPILTIIPMNSLAVDQVNVQFEMEVNQQISRNENQSNTISHTLAPNTTSTQLKGRISYDSKEDANATSQYRRQNSSSLKVEVNAAPLPLPVGVNTILDLYQKSIQPIQLKEQQ